MAFRIAASVRYPSAVWFPTVECDNRVSASSSMTPSQSPRDRSRRTLVSQRFW